MNQQVKQSFISQSGFTLIELIGVIIIVGIVAVMVTPRFMGATVNLEYEARRVMDDIRYTQSLSMTTGFRYRWTRLSANTYQIVDESGAAVILPNGSTVLTLATGIVFGTFTNLPSNLIAFDTQGTPYTTSAIPGTALASTATIPMSGGGNSKTITIRPETGFVS